MSEIEYVLDFWLGASGADGALDPARRKMWFGDGRRYDAEIRKRFDALHERGSSGGLERDWGRSARGRLALILLLDQFSRHIHRGTARAFAQDEIAQRLATDGVERGIDAELIPAGRAFFYMPLEHAENAVLQRLSVRCFEELTHEVAPGWRKDYDGFIDYACRHREIIERFGRFPHRNAVLARASTAEEIEFLGKPGSSF